MLTKSDAAAAALARPVLRPNCATQVGGARGLRAAKQSAARCGPKFALNKFPQAGPARARSRDKVCGAAMELRQEPRQQSGGALQVARSIIIGAVQIIRSRANPVGPRAPASARAKREFKNQDRFRGPRRQIGRGNQSRETTRACSWPLPKRPHDLRPPATGRVNCRCAARPSWPASRCADIARARFEQRATDLSGCK